MTAAHDTAPVESDFYGKLWPDLENRDIRELGRQTPTSLGVVRSAYWKRLAASRDPEEKLMCQKAINKLSEAIGVSKARRNADEWARLDAEEARQSAAEAHERALAIWR